MRFVGLGGGQTLFLEDRIHCSVVEGWSRSMTWCVRVLARDDDVTGRWCEESEWRPTFAPLYPAGPMPKHAAPSTSFVYPKGIDNADRSRVDGHGRFMSCDEHSQLNLNMHLLKLQQTIKLAHISTHIESDVVKLSAAVNIVEPAHQPT